MGADMGKDGWVEMFRAIGLDDATMARWHREFESRFPERHESFLRWLGIDGPEVARIRTSARTGQHP